MKMDTILCATDGSDHARTALDIAADLAHAHHARVLVLHVQGSHGSGRIPEALEILEKLEHIRLTEADILRAAAEQIAKQGVMALKDRGVAQVEALVVEGDPARQIIETARERGVDVIVLGSRGLGDLQGLLLGSVSHKVAHLAPCTCIIAK